MCDDYEEKFISPELARQMARVIEPLQPTSFLNLNALSDHTVLED